MFIRLPISEDNREFLAKFEELFPHVSTQTAEYLHAKYRLGNVLQVLYDKDMRQIAVMTLDAIGQQAWQFTSEFLIQIPNLLDMDKDEFDDYVDSLETTSKPSGDISVLELDNVLQKIAESGYDSLEDTEKLYLKKVKTFL